MKYGTSTGAQACRGQRESDVPGLGMEKGLSNLAFPRLNLSSMRSCESVDVELWGGAQILTMCQKAVRHCYRDAA